MATQDTKLFKHIDFERRKLIERRLDEGRTFKFGGIKRLPAFVVYYSQNGYIPMFTKSSFTILAINGQVGRRSPRPQSLTPGSGLK